MASTPVSMLNALAVIVAVIGAAAGSWPVVGLAMIASITITGLRKTQLVNSAIVHDCIYRARERCDLMLDRRDADRIFRLLAIRHDLGAWPRFLRPYAAWVAWLGVRLFGWLPYYFT